MLQTRSLDNEILIPEIAKLIKEGHTVKMTVKGRSMRPFIEHERDKVVLAAPDNIKIGDVILAKTREKNYVIHRLTEMDTHTGQCILRGDGNLDLEHCTIADIMAKVTEIIRTRKEHHYTVDCWQWKIYSWFWTHQPLIARRYMLALYRRLPGKR